MNKLLLSITAVALIIGASACNNKKKAEKIIEIYPAERVAPVDLDSLKVAPMAKPAASILPKAIIYRTSGDYINNVPVTTNAEANALVTYPAPTDITSASKPIKLADGYYLDRRGIAPNTFFTKYTYDQYSRLKQVPTQKQLLESIIPGAYVTEIVQLPITANAAATDTTLVNNMIRTGLKDCTPLWTIPTLKL